MCRDMYDSGRFRDRSYAVAHESLGGYGTCGSRVYGLACRDSRV